MKSLVDHSGPRQQRSQVRHEGSRTPGVRSRVSAGVGPGSKKIRACSRDCARVTGYSEVDPPRVPHPSRVFWREGWSDAPKSSFVLTKQDHGSPQFPTLSQKRRKDGAPPAPPVSFPQPGECTMSEIGRAHV